MVYFGLLWAIWGYVPIFFTIVTLGFLKVEFTFWGTFVKFRFVFLRLIAIVIAVQAAGRFVGLFIFKLILFEFLGWFIQQRSVSGRRTGFRSTPGAVRPFMGVLDSSTFTQRFSTLF